MFPIFSLVQLNFKSYCSSLLSFSIYSCLYTNWVIPSATELHIIIDHNHLLHHSIRILHPLHCRNMIHSRSGVSVCLHLDCNMSLVASQHTSPWIHLVSQCTLHLGYHWLMIAPDSGIFGQSSPSHHIANKIDSVDLKADILIDLMMIAFIRQRFRHGIRWIAAGLTSGPRNYMSAIQLRLLHPLRRSIRLHRRTRIARSTALVVPVPYLRCWCYLCSAYTHRNSTLSPHDAARSCWLRTTVFQTWPETQHIFHASPAKHASQLILSSTCHTKPIFSPSS